MAQAILHGLDYATTLRDFGRRSRRAGYGGRFLQWLANEEMGPYNS